MSSVEELESIASDPSEKPLNKPKPAPRRKLKANKVSTPEHSLQNKSITEEKSFDVDVNVFVTKKGLQNQKVAQDLTSDDISEITNSEDHQEKGSLNSEIHPGTSSELPLSSDLRSYREKLRERFQAVKKKSTQNIWRKKNVENKFRSHADNIISLNKSLEALKVENSRVEEQFHGRKRFEYVVHDDQCVSKAEKYQFFVESLPLDRIQDIGQNLIVKDDVEIVKDRKEEEIIEKKLKAENFDIKIKESEDSLFGNKRNLGINLGNDEETGLGALNLEDDGLHVPNPPEIPRKHLEMLRKRLEPNRIWFDSADNIIFDETFCAQHSYRPDNFSKSPTFNLSFQKPSMNIGESLEKISIEKSHLLQVNVGFLKFKDHYLFSPEHILQETLINNFDTYVQFKRGDRKGKLLLKLESLRENKKRLQEQIHSSGDCDQSEIRRRIEDLMEETQKVREDYFDESGKVRKNVLEVLNAWKSLKKLREENQFSCTSIKLCIRKEKQLEINFEDVFDEVLQEMELQNLKETRKYKKELLEWKNERRKLKNKSNKDFDEFDLEKPQKPEKNVLQKKKIIEDLKEKLEKCFGDEKEPQLNFTINYDHPISKANNDLEIKRRKNLQNTKIFLKFFYNQIEICKSKVLKLNDNFTLPFEESFSLKLAFDTLLDSSSITVEIFEQIALNKTKISEIELKIMKNSQTKYKEIEFSSTINSKKKVSGFLNYLITKNKENKLNGEFSLLNEDFQNENGTIDLEKLSLWVETTKPDPQDPKNAVIFDYLRQKPELIDSQTKETKYFRCDTFMSSLTLKSNGQSIEDNVRFQLLLLRNKNEPEFVDMLIPNRIKEIPSNIFATYKRRLAEENYEEYLEEDVVVKRDEIIMQRSLGRKYLKQIHTKIFQLCRNSADNLTIEDVLDEKLLNFVQNYLKVSVENFFNWFKFSPGLNKPLPVSPSTKDDEEEEVDIKDEEKVSVDDGVKSQHKICIHLKEGMNLPKIFDPNSLSATEGKKSSENTFYYYVEVSYESKMVASMNNQSKPKDGVVWNQILKIPLDYSSVDYLNPNALNGNISLNIFQRSSRETEDEESPHLWIGFIEIPISAACETKLNGSFIVNTPNFAFDNLSSYTSQTSATSQRQNTSTSRTPRNVANLAEHLPIIELAAWIEPKIPKLTADLHSLPSNEPPYLKDHILDWNKMYNNEHSKRKFNALVIDSTGKTVCLTRLIKALEPPQLNSDGFDVSAEQCARYVSLIPFTSCNRFYQNLALTAEQVLKLGLGSRADHAIMLTCYMLSLNLEVWLLLGYSNIYGNCSFVLQRQLVADSLPNYYVFDVYSGLKFLMTDRSCPLSDIFCVVNENNIWANLQRNNQSLETVNFDFNKRFDWLPLFNQKITAPVHSAQRKIEYLSNVVGDSLKVTLEKKIYKKIAKVRAHDVTVWNHYVCNLLKGALGKLEMNFMHGKTNVVLPTEIQELSNNYQSSGFIICLPFQSVNCILDRILRSKVWQNFQNGVEFAAAVDICSYSNQIVAVWLAILTLNKKF